METQKIEKVYSFYSGFYDLIFGRIFHDSRTEVIRLLDLKPEDRVLEVGVGTGLSLPFYPPHCHVVGIDLTGRMLEKGLEKVHKRGLQHIDLLQMDAAHMALADDSFDAVTAAYVMTAVPFPHQVLSEMCRVCRPGGKIILLNHFSNDNPFVFRLEKSISPWCARIGFRTDLALEDLLQGSSLVIRQRFRANPFRFWQIIECINRKSPRPS